MEAPVRLIVTNRADRQSSDAPQAKRVSSLFQTGARRRSTCSMTDRS
ncbi:hypothetical protein [Alienimonas sp. DA493]